MASWPFESVPLWVVSGMDARLEARIAFDSLLRRHASLDLAGQPRWRMDRMNARGLAELPVALVAA